MVRDEERRERLGQVAGLLERLRGVFDPRGDPSPEETAAPTNAAVARMREAPPPLVYAVGDIHGMDDLLAQLLLRIEDDADRLDRPARVIFLGDLVNRGPRSRDVIERIMAGPTRTGDDWIAIAGNHERLMLAALRPGDPAAFRRWLKKGGRETLRSYGLGGRDQTLSQALRAVDPTHLEFLAALPLRHIEGRRLFVHAGVEPRVPLERQKPELLTTIRKPFLSRDHRLPYLVVHGHTPTDGAPLIGPGRIGVDTGAVSTGVLTALVIESDDAPPRFLQATRAGHNASHARPIPLRPAPRAWRPQ